MPNDRRFALILVLAGGLLLIGGISWLLFGNPNTNAEEFPAYITRQVGFYYDVERVTLPTAKEGFDQGQVIFVDTRPVDAYQDAHIPGAINMPDENVPESILTLPSDTWIITYCT